MLRISRLADYATVLLSDMVGQSEPMPTKILAQQTKLPLPTVRKVMKMLVEASLVESLQGTQGGYRLARKANDISMSDIIAVMDGPMAMTDCVKADSQCDHAKHCHVSSHWYQINQKIDALLKGISLQDMQEPVAKPITIHKK